MNYTILRFLLLVISSSFLNVVYGQKELLQAGPMLGYSDFREALIWVQTTEAADVKIAYWNDNSTKKMTKSITSNEESEFIVKLFPHEVEYGGTYDYEVYINDQLIKFDYPLEFQIQELWQFRTDPPEMNFAIGSCVYINDKKDNRPGKDYGGQYGIFEEIRKKNPDFMVWLGDNNYLRVPDFFSKRGIQYRFKKDRSTPELQPLLGSVHHYAIWDDHDYGPNNSDWTYAGKKHSEEAFNMYWGNPNTNMTGEGGITGTFVWGDVQFFLMDNRYHRDPNNSKRPNKALLGKAQMDWLMDGLVNSQAAFKIVCIGGQTINSAAVYENYATYPDERQELLDRLHAEKIPGVLFFSGDRHHTEVSKMERENAYPLIDITCSPLTSGTHEARDEGNIHLVEGTAYNERNFGIVNISGKFKERKLTLTIYNNQGEKVYDYEVDSKDLRYKK